MVARSSASNAVLVSASASQGPVRTCIGCRQRAAAAELLRVIGQESATDSGTANAGRWLVVPDPAHRAAGRGAWLHRDPGCFDTAQRRRAFGRALRVSPDPDPEPLRRYLAELPDGPGA